MCGLSERISRQRRDRRLLVVAKQPFAVRLVDYSKVPSLNVLRGMIVRAGAAAESRDVPVVKLLIALAHVHHLCKQIARSIANCQGNVASDSNR
jgi:hypothetical protein